MAYTFKTSIFAAVVTYYGFIQLPSNIYEVVLPLILKSIPNVIIDYDNDDGF